MLDKKIEEPSSMYEEDPVASLLDEKVEDTAPVDLDELAKTTSFEELKESLENDIEDVNGYMADSKPAPEPEIEEFNTAPLEESREDAKEYMESLENVNDYTSNIKALLDDEVYNINNESEEHDIDSYRRSM